MEPLKIAQYGEKQNIISFSIFLIILEMESHPFGIPA